MVFNNENFFFSTKLFSLKNESNNFSDTTKTDSQDESNFEENIDDNFLSLNTEFSSLSSVTTTTSAYSSCSESSTSATCFSREFENANEDESLQSGSEAVDSGLFYQQISALIDSHYDHKCKLVTRKVSNLSDLKQSKKLWSFVDSYPRQDLVLQIPKLLLALTSLESELVKFLDDKFIFDHEFVFNLAFLLYENCERAVNLETNCGLIFEIDLNCQIEANFEKMLKFLLQKYVSKYIPLLISQQNSECASGKFWIGLFKIWLENEPFTDVLHQTTAKSTDHFQYENFLDIEMFLSKPSILNDYIEFKNSNPISQGYRQLLDNLERLQFICNDPINDYENESEMYGRVFHDRSRFFSYFSASYYTMGLFDLRKSLFDNPLQSIYECKILDQEYSQLFKNDSISNEWKTKMIESLRITPDEFTALFESVKSKQKPKAKNNAFKKSQWNFEMKENLQMGDKNEQKNEKSLYEEIIERIQSLNTSFLFNSYFKVIQLCQNEYVCDQTSPCSDKKLETMQSSRKWTVAPKLFAKNTTSNNCVKRAQVTCATRSSYAPEMHKRYEEYSEQRGRSDLRPIGTKPASMFTISNLNRNRAQNKYFSVNSTINKEPWGILANAY